MQYVWGNGSNTAELPWHRPQMAQSDGVVFHLKLQAVATANKTKTKAE